jgi:hypothetical protein
MYDSLESLGETIERGQEILEQLDDAQAYDVLEQLMEEAEQDYRTVAEFASEYEGVQDEINSHLSGLSAGSPVIAGDINVNIIEDSTVEGDVYVGSDVSNGGSEGTAPRSSGWGNPGPWQMQSMNTFGAFVYDPEMWSRENVYEEGGMLDPESDNDYDTGWQYDHDFFQSGGGGPFMQQSMGWG